MLMRISDRNELRGALTDLAGSSGFAGPHATAGEEDEARDRAVDRVLSMADRPEWGDDWEEWLSCIPDDEFMALGFPDEEEQ